MHGTPGITLGAYDASRLELHVSRLFVNRHFDLMYSNRSDLVLSDLKRVASGPIVLGYMGIMEKKVETIGIIGII